MIARCRPLLGTFVEIHARDEARGSDALAVETAFAAIERIQQLMSFHDPASELSRLNRAAHCATQRVHPWTRRVLRTALRMHVQSGGVFDPAIAPRLVAAGLLPRPVDAPTPDRHATMKDVELPDDLHVRFRKPLWLDLGGIAKGFAVDVAVATLRAAGVREGVVNAGGDLRVFGPASQVVHLRDPDNPACMRRAGALRNGACASSGGYFTDERARWATIDPHSGRRRRGGSVSVLAAHCAIADALTKVAAQGPRATVEALLRRYRAEVIRA